MKTFNVGYPVGAKQNLPEGRLFDFGFLKEFVYQLTNYSGYVRSILGSVYF